MDFFEEIAKYRAARRIWANRLKNQYGAKNESSLKLKFHTQTAGCSLTAQQPENNIVRTALEAMSAVLGGTNSLHTNSLDETLALPSEKAAKIALRTQQIIAFETGVPNVADPLGGSWYIEELTDKLEKQSLKYFDEIHEMGGTVQAIEDGYFQKKIAESASIYQESVDSKERIIVGVNDFIEEDILYREALRLGLDQNDRIIKRRLAQKISFLKQETDKEEPSSKKLADFFDVNKDKYYVPPTFSFTHFYFSESSEAENKAKKALSEIVEFGAPSSSEPFFLGKNFSEYSLGEIEQAFGQ